MRTIETLDELKRYFPITPAVMNLINWKGAAGIDNDCLTDPRTTQDEMFNSTVQPLTANNLEWVIVCPNCQKLHAFPKRFIPPETLRDEAPYIFQIPENELSAEFILEWKTETGKDNNMIRVYDPEGITAYSPDADRFIEESLLLAIRSNDKAKIDAWNTLFGSP